MVAVACSVLVGVAGRGFRDCVRTGDYEGLRWANPAEPDVRVLGWVVRKCSGVTRVEVPGKRCLPGTSMGLALDWTLWKDQVRGESLLLL